MRGLEHQRLIFLGLERFRDFFIDDQKNRPAFKAKYVELADALGVDINRLFKYGFVELYFFRLT